MERASLSFYKSLFEHMDPESVREQFLLALMKLQNVARGSLWERRDDGYVCIEAAGDEKKRIKGTTVSTDVNSIVGWVIENGRMTISEPGKDSRHFSAFETDLETKSTLILCFPLFADTGKPFGAVQIIDVSPGGTSARLDEEYLELLQSIIDVGSIALRNSLSFSREVAEKKKLLENLDSLRSQGTPIVGGERFRAVLEKARSYANTALPVLLTGESGTGKERVASLIHECSPRKKGPFLAQNCSAIPDTLLESELFGYKRGAFTGAVADKVGLFQAADGGTVFLDEIGDMPANLQARILRFTQDGEVRPLGTTRAMKVDVRIVAATNRDLKQAVAEKSFRGDLFYRLSVLPLELPPLRDRKEDIPLLLNFFLQREAALMNVPLKPVLPEALSVLKDHTWPGNVRELENLVKYLLIVSSGDHIMAGDLPDSVRGEDAAMDSGPASGGADTSEGTDGTERPRGPSFSCTWDELEQQYVTHLLEKNRWNVTAAAAEAGVNRSTFNSRMRRLGIRK